LLHFDRRCVHYRALHRSRDSSSAGSCAITVGGDQVRLRLPPKAAPAEGLPRGGDASMHQSREAHHPARPLHSPEGGQTRTNTVPERWRDKQPGARGDQPMAPPAPRRWRRETRRPRINRGSAPLGAAAPLREASPRVYRRQFRCSGCHRLIHPNSLALLDAPSPAEMEPEVGFEPTTFRLRVGPKPSNWTRPEPSGLLRCGTDFI
jgi:hypothetical protein